MSGLRGLRGCLRHPMDTLGILASHKKDGSPITMDQIQKAVSDLYGDWSALPKSSQKFIQITMAGEKYIEEYESVKQTERKIKEYLLQLIKDYPGIATVSDVESIIRQGDLESLLELLQKVRHRQLNSRRAVMRETQDEQEQ